jgi:TolB-like protein/DNA-binding winged helix-turn-helix (wHTH) protein
VDAPRIKLAERPDFDLGGLRVSPARREVRMDEDRRELEPKVAQVLVALASAQAEVVSRDQLIEQCWDGRIVGDDALNRCIVALRHLAKQFTPEPFAIETVPRVGYCLVERPTEARGSGWGRNANIAVVMLLALLLVGGGLALGWSRLSPADPTPASIAVLPFRNLSAGDPYFAEGIGEEILGQLAREPQFRIAGRSSSSGLQSDADFRDLARRLKVDYVLEGSVRRQRDQVRVSADLVRVSDGIELWSDSYDGKLDDIFDIQQRIGRAIASALERKLVRTPELAGPLVTTGDAYNLYLTARGLIRTRKKDVFVTASNLLRDAINLDPNYAPAWSSLAESTSLEDTSDGSVGLIAATQKAVGYVRHALQLAPDLADGHRVLASLLPYGSPEALSHYRRAVELDPNNAEALIGLGSALEAAGEFDGEMGMYQRARVADPAWFRTTGQLAIRLAETGQRAEAEAIGISGFANDQGNRHVVLGRIAWIFGDYSEAARHWSIAARANSPRWSARAQLSLADAKAAVGLGTARAGSKIFLPFTRQRAELRTDGPPSPSSWKMHNRSVTAADVYRDENDLAAKLMLNARRGQELTATYNSPVGLLSLRPNEQVRADQLHEVAVVALALRQAGRPAEANRLLSEAASTIAGIYRQKTIPFALDADVAAICAVEGRSDQALSMLERAMRRGWTHGNDTDLPDIADEPAFSSLRGLPRFERIKADLAAHLARERSETEELHI